MSSSQVNRSKQRGYAIANMMLAFISEFEKNERIGIVSLFYNRLSKKDDEFKQKQQEFANKYNQALKRSKPLPKKTQALKNYEIGYAVAAEAWKRALEDENIGNYIIAINGVFLAFWSKEREILELLYGFKDEEFQQFVASGTKGHTFKSLKMVNMLLEYMDQSLEKLYMTNDSEKLREDH